MDAASHFCQDIPQNAYEYLNEVPKNTVKAVGIAFGISFTYGTLFSGGNPLIGLTKGSLSALATTIYALITPIFKRMLPYRETTQPQEEFLRYAIPLTSIHSVPIFVYQSKKAAWRLTTSLIYYFTLSFFRRKKLDRAYPICA